MLGRLFIVHNNRLHQCYMLINNIFFIFHFLLSHRITTRHSDCQSTWAIRPKWLLLCSFPQVYAERYTDSCTTKWCTWLRCGMVTWLIMSASRILRADISIFRFILLSCDTTIVCTTTEKVDACILLSSHTMSGPRYFAYATYLGLFVMWHAITVHRDQKSLDANYWRITWSDYRKWASRRSVSVVWSCDAPVVCIATEKVVGS